MGNKTSKKTPSEQLLNKEIDVLKANSKLNEKEIRDLYNEFKRESPSGKMNKKRFLNFYKQAMGSEELDSNLFDNVFAVFDSNHDGSISFSEFVLGCALANKNDVDSALELSFQMLDTSGDAHVSYDEMVNFMEKALKLSSPNDAQGVDSELAAAMAFEMFNLDKGQKLSKKQFLDGCKNNKDLADLFGISSVRSTMQQ